MKRVLIFAGAGASVERGTIWGNESVDAICSFDAWRMAHELNDVQQVMHIHNFHKGMQEVIQGFQPNQFHEFVAELSNRVDHDVTVITTNVDDLFERAGVAASKIVYLHGSTFRRRCPSCQYRYPDLTCLWHHPDQIEQCPRPRCCSRLVKTDVTFYGEQCPDYLAGIQAFNRLKADDMAIMVGSSDETFGVAQRLWETCRSRHVNTIHLSPDHEKHHLFPADLSLLDTVDRALPDLELHLRIQQSIEQIIDE